MRIPGKVTLVLAVVSGPNCWGQTAGETAPQLPPAATVVQKGEQDEREKALEAWQVPPGITPDQIGSLTGVVLDASAKPAAGVVVNFRPAYNQNTLRPFATNTDQSGRCVVPIRSLEIAASGEYGHTDYILARDPKRNLAAIGGFSWINTMSNLDLTLQPGITFAGRIKDSQGAPVTNAAVELSASYGDSGLELRPADYKGDGSFAFSAVPQGLSNYYVRASAEGYGYDYTNLRAGDIKTNRYELAPLVLRQGDR